MTTSAAGTPVIEFRDVELTYPGPPAVRALRPCDLRIDSGEFITVVGPSGSGKSTLLNIAGLLDTPTRGRYLLNGIDTGALSGSRLAALRGEHIGFVFQAFHLLPHRSALENVELAMLYQPVPRGQRRPRATAVLDRVGLGHRATALPTQMSGGERQRVAVARALVGEPSLLLCDEPTGNLDSDTAASLLALLDTLHRDGMTIVVITHDAQVAEHGQRTVTIRDGVLSEAAPRRRTEAA
ncbi:ABC transporter ATP-binding protein [Streptomyces lincolnensis]|uniref:ABC transporter ATP-binding protein n=1 Tax=Streptomyces lincolnensis TaxID=1915 RepID=UPI001E4337A5|nr:ABC transporter ATP-binding protein [Streptomyces lincolnensis]MCD7439217.1 ABC transporter ATP-binding protein [Streptomyces lincolnensis]